MIDQMFFDPLCAESSDVVLLRVCGGVIAPLTQPEQ
jgi:hypothetical protein